MNITVLLLSLSVILFFIALYLIFWLYQDNKKSKGKSGIEIVQKKTNPEEMSHMIVHELRAPVVAIKNSASLLVTGNLSHDDQKDMLKLIEDQSNKLLGTISTILDTAKVNKGRLALNKELSDLGTLIREEIKLFESEANSKHISVTADIASSLPQFYFDKVRITEALNNILSNSLKYTNENGLIKISVRPQGQNALIVVSDNGIGIAASKQRDLFKKYSQLNNSSQTQKISSGLGLYITKWIIENHGGTIRLESIEGKGTTTKITLPIETKPDKNNSANELPVIKPVHKTPVKQTIGVHSV